MARSAAAARIAGVLLAAVAVTLAAAACNGDAIHLGDGRMDGGTSCPPTQVAANEVLWIGDSWILVTPTTHTRVRDLARAAGAIGPNDDYVIDAVAATTLAQIANQYAAREAGATKVKVLIMDGGTWDTITATNVDATVPNVVATFTQFLAQVANDATVEHIIYMLPPELSTIPGVGALRAPLMQACAASTVPCHFINLQDIWSIHPEYTDPNLGFLPNDDGSAAVAGAIWGLMQQYCIAL